MIELPSITETGFYRIQVHVRYLRHACSNGDGPHPLDRKELWMWREALAGLTLHDLSREGLGFDEVSLLIYQIDELLDR